MSPHAVERLSAFLDGELSDAERREVQQHLEACASCRERLLELGLLDETARALDVEAPDGYFEALPARLRPRLRPRRRMALPAWGLAAAAALLVAVLTPLLKQEPFAPRSVPVAAPQAPAPTLAPSPRLRAAEPSGPVAEVLQPPPAKPERKESSTASRGNVVPESIEAPREGRERKDAARDAEKAEAPPAQGPAGFAAPPAPATAPSPAPSEPDAMEEELMARTEADQAAPAGASGYAAGGSLAKARRKQDEQGRADEDKRPTTKLGAPIPRSADEARALREDWRRRANRHPEGDAGDEARLGAIEAGAQAYRLSGDPRDREILRRDAEGYLARADARHAERVREILRSLEDR